MNRLGNGSAAAHEERDRLRIDEYSGAEDEAEEDSPLLAKADDEDEGRNGTAAKQIPPHWEDDFEGIPWYRKPSVSSPPPALKRTH